ncbi:HvfC/BufC N-terminal domain-containing protein [Stutzerimonas azotifigens]|uniref:DUF2063 domain-containing protein n=1 Tax=Stutzerimonas azotifigens TaxID=291995 RepID=A0ABR5Z3J1_9GAMM|nr:DNA-binding domain-containing protein [Stutzerimonas azotifigens]MBA1274778.1 DUF2063 domain-containing protein [Stutzerimonas azotifigens]
MSQPLSCFQDAFVEALYGRPAAPLAELAVQPGFALYRNGVLGNCMQALCDNFPSVERLVGHDWLLAAGQVYAHASPPTDARLIHYGADFPAFLATFEPAQELPYLPAVAMIDRLWIEAFTADLQPPLSAACLATVPAEQLGELCLRPLASARWGWFTDCPAYTLWRCNRDGTVLPDTLDWSGEGVLLVGNEHGVAAQPLSHGAVAFLDACSQCHSLDAAAAQALGISPNLNFTELLGQLLTTGALASLPDTSAPLLLKES